jgi:hypothetical protein
VLVAEHEDPLMSTQNLGISDYPELIQFNCLKSLFLTQPISEFTKTTVFRKLVLFLSSGEQDAKENHS